MLRASAVPAAVLVTLVLVGCAGRGGTVEADVLDVPEVPAVTEANVTSAEVGEGTGEVAPTAGAAGAARADEASAEELRAVLDITESYHDDAFVHGVKPASCQKYIVMHDTESEASAADVVRWWVESGNYVASHFVVSRDGSIVQCAGLDSICHHAGFGDTGHNERFGVTDESRDDKVGTVPIGEWAADYGMNSYSVGIEMVHVGDGSDYPAEQLAAVDGLIAYIDAYFGFESEIIDHKSWRTGNSDCSDEFAPYLANLRATRRCGGGT